MALGEGPHFVNISESVIHQSTSGEEGDTTQAPHPNTVDEEVSFHSELLEDYKHCKVEIKKLKKDLADTETILLSFYINWIWSKPMAETRSIQTLTREDQ
jgi:hypothetical protein